MEKRLDRFYTRLLMWVKNLSWKRHPTKIEIYGDLPSVFSIVRSKRAQFARHCFRATSEIISSLVLWKPKSVGRRSRILSFPDTLKRDANQNDKDLKTAMLDRECCRNIVKSIVSTAVEQ